MGNLKLTQIKAYNIIMRTIELSLLIKICLRLTSISTYKKEKQTTKKKLLTPHRSI